MDPLTKKLMGRLGLTPGQSQLPPVNKLRMVTLQSDLSEGEKDLHAARLLLERLQAALEVPTRVPATIEGLTLGLHEAMYKLQARERDYFAMTRFSGNKNKQILDGWNKQGQQMQQLILLGHMVEKCEDHVKYYTKNTNVISAKATHVLTLVLDMVDLVKGTCDKWYDMTVNYPFPRHTAPSGNPEADHIKIETDYLAAKKEAALLLSDDQENANSKTAVRTAMQRADHAKRIAQSVKYGQWRVPVDDLLPIIIP